MNGTPERALLLAVLEQAVMDAQDTPGRYGNDGRPARYRHVSSARRWLFEWVPSDVLYYASFPHICHELDLDPYVVATRISALLERGDRVRHTLKRRTIGIHQVLDKDGGNASLPGWYRR